MVCMSGRGTICRGRNEEGALKINIKISVGGATHMVDPWQIMIMPCALHLVDAAWLDGSHCRQREWPPRCGEGSFARRG